MRCVARGCVVLCIDRSRWATPQVFSPSSVDVSGSQSSLIPPTIDGRLKWHLLLLAWWFKGALPLQSSPILGFWNIAMALAI